MALLTDMENYGGFHSVVFVGAATPAVAFDRLPESLRTGGQPKVFNVYSTNDKVLSYLYPVFQSSPEAAGRRPVDVQGITDVQLDVGHLSYPKVAETLLALAAGEQRSAAIAMT